MRALITGATGFVGRALTHHLIESGFEVICTSRSRHEDSEPTNAGMNPMWKLIPEGAQEGEWEALLRDVDCVIHLAARVHIMRDQSSDPLPEYLRANCHHTIKIAHFAASAGVKRFIYLSSIKVNGEGRSPNDHTASEDLRYSEADEPKPTDAYGISKWEAEKELVKLSRSSAMEIVLIRPPMVYGPRVRGNLALLIRWIRRGIPLPLGAINNRRSLVALDNLVDFIALCATLEKSPRAANELFLISDDEDVSTTVLLKKIALAYDTPIRLLSIPANWLSFTLKLVGMGAWSDRLIGPLQIDCSKAKNLLGWRPVVTMDEQLRKMASHDSAI